MPTVLRFGAYRVMIFTEDHEPSHVHVIGNGAEYIFFLGCAAGPVSLRGRYNGSKREEHVIARVLNGNLEALCGAWNDLHGRRH